MYIRLTPSLWTGSATFRASRYNLLKCPLASMLAGPLCGQITLAALRGTIKRAAPCSLLCWQGAALLRCYIYDWQLSEAGMPVEGERAKESTSWVDTVCVRVCVQYMWGFFVCLTSDNGQLCSDRLLVYAVTCHTLVGVLISGTSKWLDPQHSTCTIIKLYGLDSHRTRHISHSRGGT